MSSATATAASKVTIQLWPEQFELLLESVRLGVILRVRDLEAKAAGQDLLDYLRHRGRAAAAVKMALEGAPEGADVDRVWRDVWIARVFEGCEPTTDQVKRELYEYWELLERLGE